MSTDPCKLVIINYISNTSKYLIGKTTFELELIDTGEDKRP